MKRSASKAELFSEQGEPLDAVGDAVEPIQAGPGLEPRRVREQGNVGEGSVQAATGAALQSTQAGLELESCSLQNVERGGVAVQPTQENLRFQSHISQEQPNVEEVSIQPTCWVVVDPIEAGMGFGPNVEERGGVVVHPTQVALPNPSDLEVTGVDELNAILHPHVEDRDQEESGINDRNVVDQEEEACINDWLVPQTPPFGTDNLRSGQVEPSHQEEEAGISDRVVPQTPPFDTDNLRSGQVEASHQEEEAGINDRVVPQASPIDMNNLRNDGWIELLDLEEPMDDEEDIGIQALAGPQQMQNEPPPHGTAGRRMRLQVPLCDAEGLSEAKCVLINSNERTCMSLELLHRDATCSSATITMQEEGDTKGPLCAEGSISCVTKSYLDVAQQTPQEVSGSSSTSLVHHLLGLLGDACVLTAFSAKLSTQTEKMNFGSGGFNVCCFETELQGRQSVVSYTNNIRPLLEQRTMPSSCIKEAVIAKTQHELAQAVFSEECMKPCKGRGFGLVPCLFWTAMLALILFCLFCSLCRLTRTTFTSV